MRDEQSVAYVLLSGGLDSSVCLHYAAHHFGTVVGVSVDYGQRHAKEIECAILQCHEVGGRHEIIRARGLFGDSALTDAESYIPDKDYSEIEGTSPVYVPYRNGLMLSLLASHATSKTEHEARAAMCEPKELFGEVGLFFGAHSEDARAWAYPDCTPEFIGAMANALFIGSGQLLRLYTPLQWLDKTEIVKLGHDLGVPFDKTWSCYRGLDKHCGVCPTCRSRRQGFINADIYDPTEYAS